MSDVLPGMPSLPSQRHLAADELEAHLPMLRDSPRGSGEVTLVVARPRRGARVLMERGTLEPGQGLVGDSWVSRPGPGGRRPRDPGRELTLINARMTRVLAEEPERQALAGDQIVVDLDLSVDHLPAGSLLTVGTAVVEITAVAHTGCSLFVRHFGEDAMRFVNSREGRALRLRGVHARVLRAGTVAPGDLVATLPPGAWPGPDAEPGLGAVPGPVTG